MSNYFRAVATLVGTIIGAGIFSLPYVIHKAGIITLFIYLPILAIIEYFLLKFYAEIILSTKEKHRLPGYMAKYFDYRWSRFSLVINALSDYGAILAYIIIGGIFAHQLFSPFWGGNIFIYASGLFFLETLIVFFGLKLIARIEVFLTAALILVLLLITFKGSSYISLENFSAIDWQYFFLPYGPIFFALGGGSAIPNICCLLEKEKNKIKSAIAWGVGISALITGLFAFVMTGATGANTTPDTLIGLNNVFGNGIIILTLILGIFAIATSALITLEEMREIYWWDFKLNKNLAWALGAFIPYLIYLAGVRDLTDVVSLTGAFTGGLIGVLSIILLLKVQKKPEQKSIIKNKINLPIAWLLSGLFIFGLIYEFWSILK